MVTEAASPPAKGDLRVDLAVVVPIYGCESCLTALHTRLTDSIAPLGVSYELIFVDDYSPDGAWAALRELAARDPHVHAYQLTRNFGQDAAITAGLSRSSACWTVVMDCDLQEPPEAIPELLAKAAEGFDVVRTERAARGHARWRKAASRVYRKSMSADREHEFSNMSLLSRRVVEAFTAMLDRDREYALMIDWLGFPQAIVRIEFADRAAGESSYTFYKLLRVALNGMFFRTTFLLRAVVFLGFLVALGGGLLAAYEVFFYFVRGQPSGYTSLAVMLLLLSGFIIVSIGVVGLYVGRVFEQVKARPLFIIGRHAGMDPAAGPEFIHTGGPAAEAADWALESPSLLAAGPRHEQ
ncbi:MAG: glycosyltransferase family 2 protein [Solirubrobacteraceae bacterium]